MLNPKFSSTDLVLNPDGSVYHLQLKDEDIADLVFLVGDQGRVSRVSQHFDRLGVKKANREFVTHTGWIGTTRISVISSGIGTDNMDIVMNELYAAINIDPVTRQTRPKKRSLSLVRIGTSGCLDGNIPVGSFIGSEYGLGLDGLIYYYPYEFSFDEHALRKLFEKQVKWPQEMSRPYFTKASSHLSHKFDDIHKGITASGTGFYGPQGRSLLVKRGLPVDIMLSELTFPELKIINFDMETSALYGLGRLFGFECYTCNVVIANRIRKEYLEEHVATVDALIKYVLKKVVND